MSLRSSSLRGVGDGVIVPTLESHGDSALSGRGAEPGVNGRDVGVTAPLLAGDSTYLWHAVPPPLVDMVPRGGGVDAHGEPKGSPYVRGSKRWMGGDSGCGTVSLRLGLRRFDACLYDGDPAEFGLLSRLEVGV